MLSYKCFALPRFVKVGFMCFEGIIYLPHLSWSKGAFFSVTVTSQLHSPVGSCLVIEDS